MIGWERNFAWLLIFSNWRSFFFKVEDYYRSILRSRLSGRLQQAYDWVSWFVRMRWFDYLCMGFLLLRVDATLTYWMDVWFIGHLSLPVFYLIGALVVRPLVKRFIRPKDDWRACSWAVSFVLTLTIPRLRGLQAVFLEMNNKNDWLISTKLDDHTFRKTSTFESLNSYLSLSTFFLSQFL